MRGTSLLAPWGRPGCPSRVFPPFEISSRPEGIVLAFQHALEHFSVPAHNSVRSWSRLQEVGPSAFEIFLNDGEFLTIPFCPFKTSFSLPRNASSAYLHSIFNPSNSAIRWRSASNSLMSWSFVLSSSLILCPQNEEAISPTLGIVRPHIPKRWIPLTQIIRYWSEVHSGIQPLFTPEITEDAATGGARLRSRNGAQKWWKWIMILRYSSQKFVEHVRVELIR